MIRITISAEAFEAIAATLTLGSVGYEAEPNERGERLSRMDEPSCPVSVALVSPPATGTASSFALTGFKPLLPMCVATWPGSCSRATPSAQKSVSCVARQKARGPGSELGRGAWRAQIPACVHQTFGMSPRLTGFSPPSGCRQKTQSAQCDPIDSGAAVTPSPHHCWLCVCGQCATTAGRFDASGAWRRHRPSLSLFLCQKAQPAQFGGGTNGPIKDLLFVQASVRARRGYLSMPGLDFAAGGNSIQIP